MSASRAAAWLTLAIAVALAVIVLPAALAAVAAVAAVLLAGLVVRGPDDAAATPSPPEVAASSRPWDRARITELLDLFTEGILLLDGHNTVIAANRSTARMLGRPRDSMIGVSLIRAARDHVFLEVLRESAAEPREVQVADQRVIFATAIPVESGDIRRVLTLQDMTALRRAERARQDLIANVSHELRTPIAAALALAETLEGGVDEEEQRARFSSQLASEIERLGSIVDRLLRLSRIESRAEEFRMASVSVAPLLDEAVTRLAPVAERRQVRLEHEVSAGVSAVHADRERILEVLSNLLDNAVRYSPTGGVVRLAASPYAELVRFDVRDQGPGILPHDRLRIFERFYTGDRARADGPGTGLGLAIARHIVGRHGGEIWVAEDSPGARLSFTLPPADIEPTSDAAATGS